jgi:hypothetical protein
MTNQRVSLYDRLPEIYRIKDAEQVPNGQLQSYLALVEDALGAIHENIESLYHDLFIETCDDWVVPYIGDLLGTSTLKGDPWTLRADVADTIALRRRKGTLGAIERLTYDLTRWGVHCVELRENLVWNQHLNHQRPDEGGQPPYSLPTVTRQTVIRGGTVTLRDPAMLSLLNTPFDPFAHTADLKPPALGNIRYNLPNLAIFLWRLVAYQVPIAKPVSRGSHARDAAIDLTKFPDAAPTIVRFDVHPLGQPVRLFNTNHFEPNASPPIVSLIDETPAPIPTARLTQDSPAGAPEKYVSLELYDPAALALNPLDISDTGLQLHLPEAPFTGTGWRFRGANLCAWETGLQNPLKTNEIAIDPVIGRIAIGVTTNAEAIALIDQLLLTYTYGAVGAVGAHPIARLPAPAKWYDETVTHQPVRFHQNPNGLRDALSGLENATAPKVIEIMDSMTYALNLSGIIDSEGSLRLNRSLIIRAAVGQRPIIVLSQPLQFRPTRVFSSDPEEQKKFDAVIDHLDVRLEGLYLTYSATFPVGEPLIARAALNHLELINCTLDPGGFQQLDGTRAPIEHSASIRLKNLYGFVKDSPEEVAFKQTPEVIIQRTIVGSLRIDSRYSLTLSDSIVDANKGVNEDSSTRFAITSAQDPITGWGAPTTISGVTVFGRTRVESISGKGGIWVHRLEVLNNQKGCLKFCYFSGDSDRLPQNHGCVTAKDAKLRFVNERFGQPAYGQLHSTSDFRIRERGPNDDAMGAFGFLLEAHKWRNLQTRYREFMPVGIRPLLIPVT